MPEFTVQAFSSFTAVKRIFVLRIFKKRLFTKKHRIFILSCKYQSDCCRMLTFQDASRCAATSKMLYCNTHVHILLSELSEFRSKKTNQFRRMLYTLFFMYAVCFAYVLHTQKQQNCGWSLVRNSHKYDGGCLKMLKDAFALPLRRGGSYLPKRRRAVRFSLLGFGHPD